jgi:ATP-binding cassette subfamily C protein
VRRARLSQILSVPDARPRHARRQPPLRSLTVAHLSVTAPGGALPVLRDVGFELSAGAGLGIVGPSASGKSTLARALAGVWPPAVGAIRLDGIALAIWSEDARGRHTGYLPQDVCLFSGSVAANIARFDPDAAPQAVTAAAMAAGIHDMIARLPASYCTQIGDDGLTLSAGQRQRIGLARALFREPFLVVLDEPDASPDVAGQQALRRHRDSHCAPAFGTCRRRHGARLARRARVRLRPAGHDIGQAPLP